MPLACMGCFHRPSSARWTGGAIEEEEVSRGVSRKARRHIIKIRMPESPAPAPASESVPTDELVAPQCGGRPDTLEAQAPSPPEDRVMPTPQQPDPGAAGDMDAVVAVKVRKSGIFGMFRKPVGGPDDVVLVPAGETCVICMEAFRPSEVLQVLLCQHLYHDRCIDRWLEDHTSCCVCKADMEEMAKAVGKPSRRRSSRGAPGRSETRSERSADDRSESGYGSDQDRSAWCSLSAPAVLVDRIPPDARLADCERQTVSVLPGRTQDCPRPATQPPPPLEPRREHDRPPAVFCRTRSPYYVCSRPAVRNARSCSHLVGGGCSPGGDDLRPPRAWPMLPSLRANLPPPQPDWSLGTRVSEEGHWITSSSSSIDSSATSTDDDSSFVRAEQISRFQAEELRQTREACKMTSPGNGYIARTLLRSSGASVPSPATSPVRPVRSAAQMGTPARNQGLPHICPLPLPPINVRDFSSPRFPSGVATLSTPQRTRCLSLPPTSSERFGLDTPPPSMMMMPAWGGTPGRELGYASTPARRRASRSSWVSPDGEEMSSEFPCARSGGDHRGEGWEEKEEAYGDEGGAVAGVVGGGVPGVASGRVENMLRLGQRSRSYSYLPRGKLNGWASNDSGDAPWMGEVVGKSPNSELGSDCVTCSTQWSEMESQVSGGSGSGISCSGETTSGGGGGAPPRRRSKGADSVSPCENKQSGHLWADGNGVSPAHGSVVERSLCHRSLSAPVIWDDD